MPKCFSFNPDLPFIKKGFRGNLKIDDTFTITDHKEKPLVKEVFKWMLSPNPQRKEKKADKYKVNVVKGDKFLRTSDDIIVWLGHASYYIQINGVRILTDPVYFDLPVIPRLAEIPCFPEDFNGIDYILLSHCHRDHLDIKTLRILLENNPGVTFLVPLNTTKILKQVGPDLNVQEAGWYQKFNTTDGIEIDFLPAIHWNRRGMFDFNKELWGSFMISGGNRPIYFAGDTSYGNHFKELGEFYGKTGIILMPIGAYKPDYLMNKYHINPQQAYVAFNELDGELFLPMHYGTYDLSNEPIGEPVRKIKKIFAENSDSDRLKIADIGEEVLI